MKGCLALLIKIGEMICAVVRVISVIFMTIILSSVTYQVILRFVFGKGTAWTEPLVTYVLVGIAMMGAALNLYNRREISLTLLSDKLSPRTKFFASLGSNILVLLFLIFLVVKGMVFAEYGMRRMSPGLNVSMYWFYLCIPVGAATMTSLHVLKSLEEIALPSQSVERNEGHV